MNVSKIQEFIVPLYHLELVREKDIQYKDVLQLEAVAEVFHEMLDNSPVEKLAIIHANTQMKMIGAEIVAIGSLDRVGANMCDIFKGAIRNNAHTIYMAHNHVDGNVQASPQDYLFTQRVIEAGMIMSIPLFDHLVIAPEKYFSIWNHPEEMRMHVDKFKKDMIYKQMMDSLGKLKGSPYGGGIFPSDGGTKELAKKLFPDGKVGADNLTNQLLDILDGLEGIKPKV